MFWFMWNDHKSYNTLWCCAQKRLNNGVRTEVHQSSSCLCRLSGVVYVADREAGFGLASQEPWIQHASVRDNILFGKDYDPALYRAVIEACALSDDLNVRLLHPSCLLQSENFIHTVSLHITATYWFFWLCTRRHIYLLPMSGHEWDNFWTGIQLRSKYSDLWGETFLCLNYCYYFISTGSTKKNFFFF